MTMSQAQSEQCNDLPFIMGITRKDFLDSFRAIQHRNESHAHTKKPEGTYPPGFPPPRKFHKRAKI